MSISNIFLEGTLLTSTKNKYIDGNLKKYEDGSKQNITGFYKVINKKRKSQSFSPYENNRFTSTKCQFLVQDKHQVRKKAKICKPKSRSIEYEEELCDFDQLSDCIACPLTQSDGAIACMENASVNSNGFLFKSNQLAPSSGFCFESAPKPPQNQGFFGDALLSSFVSDFGAEEYQRCASRIACKGSPTVRTVPGTALFGFGSKRMKANGPTMGHCFGLQQPFQDISETVILEMPSYSLNVLQLEEKREVELSYDTDSKELYQKSVNYIRSTKLQFLTTVSMALLYSSDLKNKSNAYRVELLKCADVVREFDPEFILKVALYARQELNIRSVSNFLLSYAAFHINTRFYLEKYFDAAIVLPTDWIQVAEYFQELKDGEKDIPLAAALRRVMKKTFSKFDEYQLAKYDRGKAKKKVGKVQQHNDYTEDIEDKNTFKLKTFTLKNLIRTLHINSPIEHVMCLLGKKYPDNQENFVSSGLPGKWDATKAGKRMKLPTPETWETQISSKGNKSIIWESLIDNNKLPYMAMLRNLRNLILSGISPIHHKKVLKQIENKKLVLKSRQLPTQFYEAYKALSCFEDRLNKNEDDKSLHMKTSVPAWKKIKDQKDKEKMKNISSSVVQQYKVAVSKALEISALNNLDPIPGKTLVICAITPDTVFGKNNAKLYDTCLMMGLICIKACEDSKMCVICHSDTPVEINLEEDDNFLDVLMTNIRRFKDMESGSSSHSNFNSLKTLLESYLKPQTMLMLKLNHVVFLHYIDETNLKMKTEMDSFLVKYRKIINPDLLYTDVNFSISTSSFSESSISKQDVYLCGSSSSLIKFIANRSSGGQLECVENIDLKFELPDIPIAKKNHNEILPVLSSETVPLVNYRLPKWHTVKVFISSTFKDMLSERDLLIRYVFPELKRRAASIFVNVIEIDLRWGITEADSSTKRAAEICLIEAQEADLFVGFIGDRYGSVVNFDSPYHPALQWLNDYPPGLSITELEIHAAALRHIESFRKTFFYFRDNKFLSHIPPKWAIHFQPEDQESKVKVNLLKEKIKSGDFKIFENYPCHWAGIYENKPILAGLDILGSMVLEDLWKAVQDIHDEDPFIDICKDEEEFQQMLLNSVSIFDMKYLSVQSVLKELKSEHEIIVICGDNGSGKTAFFIKLLHELDSFVVVKFFVGVSPNSQNLSHMIRNICSSLCKQLSITISIPDLSEDVINQFSDFLIEAANNCGGRDIIILLDGLDHLDVNDQKLDWLPFSFPKNLKFVCSVSESSEAFKVLCDRQSFGDNVFFEMISPIQQSDRELFVRNYLRDYKKILDESAFNNHLLKIVTKKDSYKPLYLRLVCDFLRIYGSFDNLVSVLQKLPSTVILLFQEIILQMENEFGTTIVQNVLSFLCITKLGLEDNDLHHVLSLTLTYPKFISSFAELKEKMSSLKLEDLFNQVKYCSLMHILETFALGKFRQPNLTLNGSEFEQAVRKIYMNKNYDDNCVYLHSVLAAYYHGLCDINNDGTYKGNSGNAITALLYHMLEGKVYKELYDMLCNHFFIEASFRTKVDDQILEYYLVLLDAVEKMKKISREINCDRLYSFYDFVSRNFYIFHQHPSLVMQQALNEPVESFAKLENIKFDRNVMLNLSRSQIVSHRVATLSGFVKNITASCSEKQKSIVFLGSENGCIKVLNLTTRKIEHSMKSHSSAITCICYASKNRVCVASADGTLSIWDSQKFTRVAVLKGHRHNVTGCCSDPSGCILFSSGWDNSVRLWSLGDGREISVIDEFRCPVNCIAHHPTKQQIACGLWNGNIEIWDTISMQRKNIFSYRNGSVKSISYTPDGVNVLSCFIQSEVSILSSEEGLKMSSLKGHLLPVKSISFSNVNDLFVSGSDDCTLKVWPSASGFAVLDECKFCPISLLEFISDSLIAVVFQNSEIWIIDFIGEKICAKFKLVSDVPSCISKYQEMNFDDFYNTNIPIDQNIIFGTQSGKIMFGNTSDNSTTVRFEMDSKILTILHNLSIILCGTAHGTIGLFSFNGDCLSTVLPNAHKGFITSFCFAPSTNGFHFVSSSNDNVIKIWKFTTKNEKVNLEEELFNKHRDIVTCSMIRQSFSSFKKHGNISILDNLLTGSHDNNVILWTDTSEKVFRGLQSSVVNIKCSNDYVIGCGNDGAVVIWSYNGKILTSIPRLEWSATTLSFHVTEDESHRFSVLLAFVSDDGSVKITKPLQRKFSSSLEGHTKPITSCCISESGEIISCSLDGSVNVWRMPLNVDEKQSMHSGNITSIILQSDCKYFVSSDANGNIILWKLDLISSSFIYMAKKSFAGSFIRALSWLKEDTFVCAVSQMLGSGESYFLYKMQVKYLSGCEYCLDMKESYTFPSEICCLDSCSLTDIIVVGLRSGEVFVITPESINRSKISDDWILGISLFQRETPSDYFCVSLTDGSLKIFSVAACMEKTNYIIDVFAVYTSENDTEERNFFNIISSAADRFICCGDSLGYLKIYSKHVMKFSKKIHCESITGICITEHYIFTSSLDRTVKVWNLDTYVQICQFYSDIPISCLAVSKSTHPDSSDVLVIGTSSGEVQLLKFQPKM